MRQYLFIHPNTNLRKGYLGIGLFGQELLPRYYSHEGWMYVENKENRNTLNLLSITDRKKKTSPKLHNKNRTGKVALRAWKGSLGAKQALTKKEAWPHRQRKGVLLSAA